MLGGPQQEQLQQILAKMKHSEPESENTEVIQDKSPLFDEIDRNNSWQQVSFEIKFTLAGKVTN